MDKLTSQISRSESRNIYFVGKLTKPETNNYVGIMEKFLSVCRIILIRKVA
jgi:hypothetical protein